MWRLEDAKCVSETVCVCWGMIVYMVKRQHSCGRVSVIPERQFPIYKAAWREARSNAKKCAGIQEYILCGWPPLSQWQTQRNMFIGMEIKQTYWLPKQLFVFVCLMIYWHDLHFGGFSLQTFIFHLMNWFLIYLIHLSAFHAVRSVNIFN